MKNARNLILIVEDDEKLRQTLEDFLTANHFAVLTAVDGEQALTLYYANNHLIDLILLDGMLPGMDGMAAIRKIREMPDFSAAPVLMLTAKDREMDIVQGLDNGADDYMTKPFGILELSARVRNLLKRVEPAKEEVSSLTIGEVSINRETREVIACGDRTELTLKEFELLTYLMEHINRVVTRDELLDHIWGYDYDGETRTLDMHIKTLRQKLHDAGAQIKTVRGVGYRFLKEKEAGK